MCPIDDLIALFADAAGDAGAAAAGDAALDAGVAAATDAGVAGAADAGLTAGIADAGIGAAADAGLTAGIADAGIGAAADTGLAAGAGDLTATLGAGAGSADLGAVGALADPGIDAGISGGLTAGGATGATGGAGALTATAPAAADGIPALDEVTITGSAGGGASSAGSILPALGAAGAGAAAGGGLLKGANLPGGAAPAAASSAPSDIGQGSSSDSFLAATGDSDVSGLDPGIASQFGVGGAGGSGVDTGYTDTLLSDIEDGTDPTGALSGGDGSFMNSAEQWLSNPKNAATAGLLGISGFNALSKPKLPGAEQTALNSAVAGIKSAQPIVQSGGTATPEWAGQKASIDATIDQQIQQQTEAIEQAAATSGEGSGSVPGSNTPNSGIVAEQVAQMTANLNVQRQQLYEQAQMQNVTAALNEIAEDNSILTSIGQTELAQSEEARQAAGQTAEMALMLQGGKLFG